MKKRMLALLLAAVLLLTLLPRTAVPEASAASNSCAGTGWIFPMDMCQFCVA